MPLFYLLLVLPCVMVQNMRLDSILSHDVWHSYKHCDLPPLQNQNVDLKLNMYLFQAKQEFAQSITKLLKLKADSGICLAHSWIISTFYCHYMMARNSRPKGSKTNTLNVLIHQRDWAIPEKSYFTSVIIIMACCSFTCNVFNFKWSIKMTDCMNGSLVTPSMYQSVLQKQ